MQMLGQTWFEKKTEEDAAALEPTGDDPAYAVLYDELRRLGFLPIGLRWTSGHFYEGHWAKTFRSLTYATPLCDCFAAVYRLFEGEEWRLCFLTVFTNGGLVESANQMECLKIQEEDFWRWGFATSDREELLRLHRELIEQYGAAAGCTVDHSSLEQLSDVVTGHEARIFRKNAPTRAATLLLSALGTIVVPALALGSFIGMDQWALPLVVLAGAVRYHLSFYAAIRLSSRQMRSEELAGRPASGEPAA